jgi:hypothetical protein
MSDGRSARSATCGAVPLEAGFVTTRPITHWPEPVCRVVVPADVEPFIAELQHAL